MYFVFLRIVLYPNVIILTLISNHTYRCTINDLIPSKELKYIKRGMKLINMWKNASRSLGMQIFRTHLWFLRMILNHIHVSIPT